MAPILEVDNLSKMYEGLTAVRDLSFTVEKGDIVGLIGPNGAGKTTTFEVITGFQVASAGRVVFNGTDCTGRLPHDIVRLGLGRTFQASQPFPLFSALENVKVAAFLHHPTRRAAEQKAWEVLKRVNLASKAHFLAKTLTLADNKRLEIARALATGAEMILLDEAMAGLTPVEADEAIEFILSLNREDGVTFLVIEHVMQIISSISKRILVLNHGEKIAEGTPDVVLRNPRVVKAYLGDEAILG